MSDNGNIGINNSGTYVVSYWDPETKTWKYYADDELGELRRDNLKLSKINENGTISEMIKTIDENFRNIAAHGGGPAGFDGMDGINGADGTSAEYIFALCDEELEAGTHYPTTDLAKNNLFDSVEMNGSQWFPSKNSNIKIQWFDHPQGVSKEHKNEYVFSRVVRVQGETRKWEPAEKPELWAHWGETGRDGDGVEYIFMRSKTKLDESTLEDIIIKKKSMSGDKYQSVIYQMDDFFPGEEWFKDDKNKTNVWKAINAKYGEVPSDFETLWSNRFNMIVPDYNWTDEPKGTDPVYVYEYVAIRRCNVDDEDRKEWGDFSTPAIWSHYGLSTRTIIIYCNIEDTVSPVSPQTGQGIWNESEGKLTLPDSLVKAGWKDTNETPSETQITWMCSGIFDNSGKNVSWSKPMRITGKDGKQGEDGTTVEFIYVLSKNMPAHPDPTTALGKIDTEKLFDDVEASKSKPKSVVDKYGNTWFDRAQPISPDKPTEYVWSRRRDKESEPWEYDDEPIIWAHWGEDGTDGDGVEYIFAVTLNNPPTTSLILPVYKNLNDDQKKIFQIDDFYPDDSWFTKTQVKNGITTYPNKEEVQKVLGDRFDEVKWSRRYDFNVSSGWSDNPVEVSPSTPYQWVSIRRSHTDETTGGKRFWEDFSTPVLWNSYGKRTRSFIVYCNMSDETTPESPAGGWWNTSNNTLQMSKDNSEEYKSNALSSDKKPDYTSNVGYWSDKNIDVSGTITWISTGEFSDSIDDKDSNNISWSAPFRITGAEGKPGADGSNIEYIYALCDDEASLKYPKKGPSMSDADYMATLDSFFDDVNASDNEGYWPKTGSDRQKWTDNPQGVSNEKGKRTEWVWSRSKPAGKTTQWEYTPKPVKWSHWAEDGTDGDGVEYIFYHGTSIDGHSPNKELSTDVQKAIYQMSDFYPGEAWFNESNKGKVESQLGKTFSDDEWTELKNYFNLGWTDNPSGVDFEHPFEWVSIRRTKNDPEDKYGKIWGSFGEPKPWANYNIDTRVFMVYCNLPKNATPTKPKPDYGKWDKTEGLIGGTWVEDEYGNVVWEVAKPEDEFAAEACKIGDTTYKWYDTITDDSTKIAWLCSGTYAENGRSISWSDPFRITGAEGKAGADGNNIEFVYCLSDTIPAFPNDSSNPDNDYTIKCKFFEEVEKKGTNGHEYTNSGQTSKWFDNPQGIEDVKDKRTEWVWSRSKSANATADTKWVFHPKPVIWSRWGEDGTDGDGVEYIFMLSGTTLDDDYKNKWNTAWKQATSNWNNYEKAIYSMDDFIPNSSWFSTVKYNNIKPKVQKIIEAKGEEFIEQSYNDAWNLMIIKFSFDVKKVSRPILGTWYDNPQDLTPSNKYQYVSIRKMNNGEWGKFSYPKLWSKYNISSFTEFAFTATTPDVDLSNYEPKGGTFSKPKPTSDYNNLGLVWSDGPKPVPAEGKTIIWMTSAKFKEDDTNSPTWSACQRMADTSTFQVEWSSQELSDVNLNDAKTAISSSDYNFGKFLTEAGYNADTAESNWRKFVLDNLKINFSDTSGDAILMATCQEKNGKWSNWKLDRVKGEKGDDGKPGADGSNIEFVYALTDDIPHYPKEETDTIKCKFFDSIERAKEKDFSNPTQNTDPNIDWDNILYNNEEKVAFYRYYPNKSDNPDVYTDWYDSPQGIQDVKGKRSEWVWSRNKAAGNASANWTYANTASIWSHWGEDGADGDGVEYIFIVKNVESYPDDTTTKANWNSKWTVFTDANASVTAKAIYAMDDFCPSPSWFNNNKDNVKNSMENPSKDFDEVVWNEISTNMSGLGNWTDNPENISATNKYQYVSIRKTVDGKWGPFSYPKLWSKYNITKFNSVVFTKSKNGVNLGTVTVSGGTFDSPYPDPIEKDGFTYKWSDGPEATNKNEVVWMTSATFKEDHPDAPYVPWSSPKKMTDTADFNVEWSSDDLTISQVTTLNTILNDSNYNFGTLLKNNSYNENAAETAWRNAVKEKTMELFGKPIEFSDQSAEAVLMATCSSSGGTWTNWVVSRVKGEQGEPGTSIKVKGKIAYEVNLNDGDTYNYDNAETAKNNAVLSPQPQEGRLLIVYPHSTNSDGIYEGDVTADALYMWKYVNNQWIDYNSKLSPNGEDIGNTYESPNKHLILWDGDSWMDLGELQGPEGPAGKEWRILTRYANDNSEGKKIFVKEDADIPSAKYVGFLTYEHIAGLNPYEVYNEDAYTWSLFKGQDGNGYEYIFKTTSENAAPSVPVDPTGGSWSTTSNVIPGNGISDENNQNYGWYDEPMEPTKDLKYVWMCWRKYDHSTQKWTNFQGNSSNPGKARLWQVYANSINEVKEYFHADTSISPKDINTPVTNTEYWKTDKSGWDANTKYLFNVEVITFLDGKTQTLDPHLIAVWETGLVDVVDYYILESANGSGNGDPGDKAPHIDKYGTPTTEGTDAGKDYWTTSVPKMDKDYPVLWNISKKEYDGGKKAQWTTPIVIGVYGQGANGENSIYADLDNEMDSIQIDEKNTILVKGTYNTTVRLYCGSTMMRIDDIDISGEEAIMKNGYTLTYYYDTKNPDGSTKLTDIGTVDFEYNNTTHKFTPKDGETDIIGDVSLNINCIKITFTVKKNDTLKDVYSKVVISVGHNEGINETARRSVSYTFVGTTHPYVYSIVPKQSAIVFSSSNSNSSGIRTPNPLYVEVKRQVGTEKESFDTYVSTQGFDLTYTITQGSTTTSSIILNNGSFQVSTDNLKPGDYITFAVNVDNDGNNSKETTLDRETVYVLREGSDGPKGEAGNGYRYYYARYVNESKPLYSGATIAELSSDDSTLNEPIFLLNGVSLPGSSSAQGADGLHTYEYRTEKFFDGSNWSNWSKPITIAKYLTADNIDTYVNEAVTNATTDINDRLTTATSTINTLSGYFDASGFLKENSFPSGVLNGYISRNSLSDEINSIGIGGLMVEPNGTTSLFGYLQDQSNGILTAVGTEINALEGELTNYATTTELSYVASAMDTFKADAHDKFAQMDRTVANAQFMTDAEGYLMVDIPDYSIWFNTTTELSGAYKDTDIRNDVTWVLASILEGSDGSDSDSEIDEATIRTSNTLVPYIIPESKLYNTDTDTVVFVLKTVITNINIISQLTDIKNIIDREIIVTLNKLTGKYTIDYVDSGSESESESDSSILAGIYTYDEEVVDESPDESLVIMYATTDVSKGGEYGIFSNLTWTVGVVRGQSRWIESLSYVNTASLFNKPILPSCGDNEDDKMERVQYMLTLNKQYGYGVAGMNVANNENNELYNKYGELNTNGKLSITGYYGYNYRLIPENESVENIIKFIKTSNLDTAIPNDDEIGIGKSKTYYVAANKGSSVSNNSDNSYTISLPGDNKVEFIMDKEYAKPMFENKHIFNKVESKGFTNTDDGFRQTTTKEGSYDYYDMYITSKYDEVKLSYVYNITPGEPSTDTDNPSGSVSPDNQTGLYLLYWYDNELEPTGENWTMYNPAVIFETHNLADSVNPDDPVNPEDPVYPDDSAANNKQSGHGEESIFKYIELHEDKILHMKVFTDCGSDLKDVNIKYKLETSNRITYGNAFEDKKISISNITEVDSTNIEESSKPNKLIILKQVASEGSNKCKYIFNDKKSTISVTTFTSYLQNIDLRLKLEWDEQPGGGGNPDNFHYMVIPGSYDAKKLQSLSNKFNEYTGTDDYLLNGGFLNNSEFNTVGREWKTLDTRSDGTMCYFTPIDLEFNKVEADSDKSGVSTYSYTIIQYYPYNENLMVPRFTSTMTADVISNIPWHTKNGYSRSPYGLNPKYLIDKITVTVNDRERTGELSAIKRRATDKKTNSYKTGVKNYIEVLDIEKPYLIANVSELATISQMVSDGIACTQLITKAGEKQAVFFEQASKDGSIIYMNADEVGIKSNYFTLNNDGLTLTGNLYAKNTNKYITAGVIGDSSSTNDGVKFFAGISNLPSTSSDSEIKNAVKNAKFYVTESGHLHAEDADISGDITANNFSASTEIPYGDKTITKKAEMDATKFEVSSIVKAKDTGETSESKIYIKVFDELQNAENPDITEPMQNIPVLCFDYNGKSYYLTPGVWKPYSQTASYDKTDAYYYYIRNCYTDVSFKDNSSGKNIINRSSYIIYNFKNNKAVVNRTERNLYRFNYILDGLTETDQAEANKAISDKGLNGNIYGVGPKDDVTGYVSHGLIKDSTTSGQHIIRPDGNYSCLDPFAAARNSNPIYESIDNNKYTSFGEFSSGTPCSTIPSDVLDNMNSNIVNYLKNIVFSGRSDTSQWTWIGDVNMEQSGDPANQIGDINPISGIIYGGFECDYRKEIHGGYKTTYTNGIKDTPTKENVDGFAEVEYAITLDIYNKSRYAVNVKLKDNSDITTVYLHSIVIKISYGIYVPNISTGSTDPATFLTNVLDNAYLTDSDIDTNKIHLEVDLDFRNTSTNEISISWNKQV